MATHTYQVSILLGRGSGKPINSFDSLNLRSEEFDTLEDFCQAIASQLLEKFEEDAEYLEESGI